MLTDTEALKLLSACKPLAERLSSFPSGNTAGKFVLSKNDIEVLKGFARVQSDPLVAGPGLLGRLLKTSGLNQVEIYKLEQLIRMVFGKRYKS